MKSLVTSVALAVSCGGSIIGFIFAPFLTPSNMQIYFWAFGSVLCLTAIIPFCFMKDFKIGRDLMPELFGEKAEKNLELEQSRLTSARMTLPKDSTAEYGTFDQSSQMASKK